MLRAAQLEVSDLVCRNHDLAALVIRQDKDGAIGNCGSQGALDLLKGGFGVHDKFSWHGLNSDLDFHGTPLAPRPESWSKYAGPAASADQGFDESGQRAESPTSPVLRLTRGGAAYCLGAGCRGPGGGVLGRVSSAGARPAADASPGEPGEKLLGGLLGYRAIGAEPVPGADLSHADQRHAQEVGLLVAEARVFAD